MSEPTFFGDGNTPRRTDTKWTIAQKTLGAIRDLTSGGGGGGTPETAAQLHGSGSPEGVVSAKVGQHYYDEVGAILYWKGSGDGTNTGWI